MLKDFGFVWSPHRISCCFIVASHGAEQYAGDLECVFYGYHLDRAILKIAQAAYCLVPSLIVAVCTCPALTAPVKFFSKFNYYYFRIL